MLAVVLAAGAIAAGVMAGRAGGRVIPAPASVETSVPLQVESSFAPGGAKGQPTGVAVSGDRLYVADPSRGVVDVLTRDGSKVATIGAGSLESPVYVAVGPVDGRVYVSDRTRNTVVVFASTGERFGVLTPKGIRASAPIRSSWRPLALGFAPDGTLYVADSQGDQSIAVFSPAGSRIGTLGTDVPAGRSGRRLGFPNGIAATDQRVVIADSNNGRLLIFDASGRFVTALNVLGLPRGVALLDGGRIVMTDAASNQVSLLTSTGVTAGRLTGPSTNEPFEILAGLTVSDGRIYVSDSGTGRVHVVVTTRPGALRNDLGTRTQAPWLLIAALAGLLSVASIVLVTARTRAGTRERARTL